MSEQNEIILDPAILAMLSEMEVVFKRFGIDYYLAGAFARDVHFQSKHTGKIYRRTDDVDLAVLINNEDKYNVVMDALVASGSFTRDSDEIIKLYYKSGLEVDLIPFGGIEDANREVKLTKPKAFTLQMPGFLETFPFIEILKSGSFSLKTCPIEGLIMLKLISNNDRPDRTHDLTDIDNIIDEYFDWNSEEIYTAHSDVLDKYDTNDLKFYMPKISAHTIGRKMKPLLAGSQDLRQRVIGILKGKVNPRWEALLKGLTEE